VSTDWKRKEIAWSVAEHCCCSLPSAKPVFPRDIPTLKRIRFVNGEGLLSSVTSRRRRCCLSHGCDPCNGGGAPCERFLLCCPPSQATLSSATFGGVLVGGKESDMYSLRCSCASSRTLTVRSGILRAVDAPIFNRPFPKHPNPN